jgi:hypothetical protein
VASLLGVYLVATTFGSLQAFTPIPSAKIVEAVLVGLWLAVIWRLAFGARTTALRLPPGAALLGLFVLVTGLQVLFAATLTLGGRTFVSTGLYMSAALLVGLLGLDERQRERLLRGLVAISLAVAAYAVLRHVIGPAAQERQVAAQQAYNFKEGDLLLVGSFGSRHQLGAWCGLAIALCAGLAWGLPLRWRIAALATIPLAAVAILGAESRSGFLGALAGLAVVLVLYGCGRVFRGPRIGSIALAIGGILLTGALAFTVGGASSAKYTVLSDPGSDPAFQARQRKWAETAEEIARQPLGHGLGTANALQIEQGRFSTIGSYSLDNSYLRVAYEQGVAPALLFVVSLLLLVAGLVRRGIRSAEWSRAGPATAGAAALVAYMVMLYPSNVFDGYTALSLWLIVGVALAPTLRPADAPA